MNKVKLFNLEFSVGTYYDCLAYVIKYSTLRKSSFFCFANVHMVVEADRNPEFNQVLSNADGIFLDGQPLVLVNKFFNNDINSSRFAGMDAIESLLELSDLLQLKVFFYGSKEHNLLELNNILSKKFPSLKIVGSIAPPFRKLTFEEIERYVESINKAEPNLVFVSLGCPKQEIWMNDMKDRINSAMLGVGNAFLTVSKQEKRAPKWMQKIGLEWLFRLGSEPRRLWKRYLFTNSYFFVLLAKLLIFRRYNNRVVRAS